MDRRLLLQAAAAAAGVGFAGEAWGAPAHVRKAAATSAPVAASAFDPQALKALVRDGYIFSLPLLEVARTRDRTLGAGLPANRFVHRRALAGAGKWEVTTPNNDTLYSSAFLDLRKGPVTLTSPASPGRYLSLALMDAWSNNFHIAGTRTDGGQAARILLVTEEQAKTAAAEPGVRVVVAPTKWVWALGRVLVDGPADLDAARRIQDEITVTGPTADPWPKAPARDAPVQDLLAQGQLVANDAGVLKGDLGALMGFARRGLMMGLDLSALTDPDRIAVAQTALDATKAELQAGLTTLPIVQGWAYQPPSTGDFGTDYMTRAITAVAALAALPPVEAMYMWGEGDKAAGSPPLTFDGRRAWRLDLPKLPVDSFWSLSLYERMPDGANFFAANPLNRYAIGDRTAGLKREAAGGCTLWIGAADPGEAKRSNWLPAPAGPFTLVMRAYLPRPEFRDGRFRLPPVVAA